LQLRPTFPKKEKSEKTRAVEQCSAQDIHMGDIIKLKKNEVCPCDMLVIGTSDLRNNSYICEVDELMNKGHLKTGEKKGISLTKPFGAYFQKDSHFNLYLNRLTGKIEYSTINNADKFRGNIKLKSDPKVEEFSNLNLIRKGSVIRSKFVHGIVLLCGQYCNYFELPNFHLKSKRTQLGQKVGAFTMFALIFNIIWSVLSTMFLLVKKFQNKLMDKLDPKVQDGFRFFGYLTIYSPLLPIMIDILIQLMSAMISYRLEKKYAKLGVYEEDVDSKEKKTRISKRKTAEIEGINPHVDRSKLQILNPNVLSNLGNVNSVFFDKTGTLALTNYKVMSLATRKKIYHSKTDNFQVGGMTSAGEDTDDLNEFGTNLPEMTFEGYTGDRQLHKTSLRNIEIPELEVYDFLHRKPFPNPFVLIPEKSKVEIQEDTENDDDDSHMNNLDNLFNETVMAKPTSLFERKTFYNNDKNMSMAVLDVAKKNKDGSVFGKIYNELEFITDVKTDLVVRNILHIFTLCHNANRNSNQ
jgi:magnesium-transporting ATPase (P-type)